MEWVETTGRTVAEAKDAALDQLGVDEHNILALPGIPAWPLQRVFSTVVR